MDQRIDARTAAADLDRIMDTVTAGELHLYLDREGKSSVAMRSIAEYLRLRPAPDWPEALWADAEARGLNEMTMEEIDEEIAAYRREKVLQAASQG